MITLGIDVGSNSVGSAWVDTDRRLIRVGVGIFPAGVDETASKRGDPVGQKRRQARGLRRSLARRAARKRQLRTLLTQRGLLPSDPLALEAVLQLDPWVLRKRGLDDTLSPHEFGRVLVHLGQRRGAVGLRVSDDDEDEEEGRVRAAIDATIQAIADRGARTFGELIAKLIDERRDSHAPVRNRRDSFEFHAGRALVRDEFSRLWGRQSVGSGPLASLLTEDLRRLLDDPEPDAVWRHRGLLLGQRRTYWKARSLVRCALEPTDRCFPLADMHAQYFRVIETVNNLRLQERGRPERSLTADERSRVIAVLRGIPLENVPKTERPTIATIRRALGIDKRSLKARDISEEFYSLNIERDPDRVINTDWFYRKIVLGAIGSDRWAAMTERARESVNAAIIKHDPELPADADRLEKGARTWWALEEDGVRALLEAWRHRPRLESRVSLSARAIHNLLPYMDREPSFAGRWATQIEACSMLAEDATNGATIEQRERYSGRARPTRRERLFVAKHPELLPPAPFLSNPVVRKAIHEVRRQVAAYLHEFKRAPDRVVVEFARATTQSGRVRDEILKRNRSREKVRREIVESHGLETKSQSQQRKAIERVLLCRQQGRACAYTGTAISDASAAAGAGCEVDHIVPYSRSGDDGINNKVLVTTAANRDKGNRTPKEWWGAGFNERFGPADRFLGQRCETSYFTRRDYERKRDNFEREVRELDEWKNSQLTDTAYAARQVTRYLESALFSGLGDGRDGEDGRRRVFVTKGRYTAMLRRDWQLFRTLRRRGDSDADPAAPKTAPSGEKDRGDHRHHAIDAVVIALTGPQLIPALAADAQQSEEQYSRTGVRAERHPLPPPWGSVDEFRCDVLSNIFDSFDAPAGVLPEAGDSQPPRGLIVSHRPVKRRIVGALHEETLFGRVLDADDRFTARIPAIRLERSHLRVPDGWVQGRFELDDAGVPVGARRRRWVELLAIPDVNPGKSGVVRDRALRDALRSCVSRVLRARSVPRDADSFTPEDMKTIVDAGELRMPSGIPIRSVILLRAMKDPVIIPRKVWDPATARMRVDADRRSDRVYVGGNNHHVEIRADGAGRWSGVVVTTFEAAQRARGPSGQIVNRLDDEALGGSFVMSLAEGETVHMVHPVTRREGYFVVFKLKRAGTVHFSHHWDARGATAIRDADGVEIPDSSREELAVAFGRLAALAPPLFPAPRKVRVGPLGDVQTLTRD